MAELSIALLGPLQVTRRGESVTQFEADTARALLAYLALNAGTPFPREALAALLWPDQPGARALHALSQTLNRLRKAIGDHGAESAFLCITRGTIEFNRDAGYKLDVDEFSALLAANAGHRHRRLEACRACVGRLQRAAELYRGDLLAGFALDSQPFEEWLLMQREYLHRQALDALYALAAACEQRGDYEQARAHAHRQVELEPWREEAHRQLMRALALSGQRSAALSQYLRCERSLAAELGVPPDAETTALHRQIQNNTLAPGAALRHNLPAQPTPLVGRVAERAEIAERLDDPDCRLVTLAGPGGSGKTRLALQAALDQAGAFRDGVCFVPLSAVDAPEFVPAALAQALGCTFADKRNPWLQLRDFLRGKEMLLVLDSCEHVLDAAAPIAELLRHAPGVRALATSRERLDVQGEWLCPIAGLPCPEPDPPPDSEAVELFLQSARRVRPAFELTPAEVPHVANICRLVAGLPLGIELAASWLRVLSCGEIAQEIERDLDFLQTSLQDIPARHRSLRALFDSSLVLLPPAESAVFYRLSVFCGGFDRSAAEAVAGAGAAVLATLVDKSLLRRDTYAGQAPAVRYELHNLLRRYAAEKLAALPADERAARERHGDYYTRRLHAYTPRLKSAAQREALAEIGAEIRNVRAAWVWAVVQGDLAALDRALESLYLFYDLRGWVQEGEAAFRHAAEALAAAATHAEVVLRARALACRGWFAFRLDRHAEARALLAESVEALRDLPAPGALAFALNLSAAVALALGSYPEARAASDESLALCREHGDDFGAATALNLLGRLAAAHGDYAAARERCREALALAQRAGLDAVAADSLRQLGNVAYYAGDFPEARAGYERALERYRALGNEWGESATLGNLGAVLAREGDHAGARAYFGRCLALKQQIGDRRGMANVLGSLGVLLADEGDYRGARAHYEQALGLSRETGTRAGEGLVLNNLGNVFVQLGCHAEARAHLDEALALRRELGDRQGEGRTLDGLSLLCHHAGDDESARIHAAQALEIARELGNHSGEGYALTHLGHALAGLGRAAEAAAAYAEALAVRREAGETHLACEPLAGLARMSLAQGDRAAALAHVEELLDALTAGGLTGAEEPLRVHLTCYEVLLACGDARAPEVLARAQRLLHEGAARLGDAALRRTFLENVPANRALAGRGG